MEEVSKAAKSNPGGKYKVAQDYKYTGDDYWDWSVWIDASDADLDKIDKVVYNLHFSFREPVQVIKTRQNKFKLKNSGWGTFTMYVRISFKDDTVLDLEHELELNYPDETTAEE
jgi:transcription initiation factor IIF auxiliary subunit